MCRTNSGRPFSKQCHKQRESEATKQNISLTECDRPPDPEVQRQPADTPGAKLRLALWYVETAGGIEPAKKWLDAAVAALQAIGPEENDGQEAG